MNPLKKLLGQTAVYGLSSILGRMLNFLLVPLYLYVFKDPSDYGVISQLYAFTAFLMVFLTFGMETSFFRFIQDKPDKQQVFRNSFLTVIGLNVLFFLLVLFFNKDIADLLLFSDHKEYIILIAAIIGIDAVASLPLARLRAEEQAKRFAAIQFLSIGVNIVLNLFFLLVWFDEKHPESGVFMILIANLISSLVKPAMLYKDFLNISFKFDWKLALEMSKYAFPIVIAGFAFIVNETIDRVMLKQILSEQPNMTPKLADAQIGIYSACYKLAMLVSILLQAYRYAAEPFFFNQSKNQDRNKIYVKLMNYFVAIMCIIFLGIALNIDIFKYFITSETYRVGLPVVPILLMANVFLGIYLNQSIWYKLSDQTKFGAYIALGGAVLTILINYLFIPSYGYMASAWATMIVYGAQMVASYLLGQKYFPIRYNLRKFYLYMGFTVALFFLAKSFHLEDGSVFKFIVNNILIAVFIGLVMFMEGIKLRRPKKM
ncbi:MAG: polysaccharide biosynthesis protein [Flavobacteriia bacterium]|nr:polysaccharide biosynthesis protein [Flavobacteriia bacterium]